MTNIDISPEAVEHLCAIHEGYEQHGTVATLRALSAALDQSQDLVDRCINTSSEQDQTTYELREALTKSQAEVAAAYERAAREADRIENSHLAANIRALATPDQSSALAAVIAGAKAEALSGPWEDKPDALTDALELVSNRHGTGALVGLVNYLMAQNKAAEAGRIHRWR